MRHLALIVLTLALLAPLTLGAQSEQEVTVPLSSLVLFTSGVGYFQHDGTVEGNARMEMTFSTSQINDLLKSLVLQDLDGGSVSSVTYSSRDPITRTLKGFSIDLTSNPTLASLLLQTRGEAVTVTLASGSSQTGTIIGVETRTVGAGAKGDLSADYLTLNTNAGITSVALNDVQDLRFLRKEVQDDLAAALRVLSSSHGVEKKKVVLHFAGRGKRRLRIGYILEAPVWKTTYRLVLGESSHLLQGWALVENTSDTDWHDVALTLVSGRPITFVMDLYQPLYIQRPEVQLELYQSLMPKTNQMALGEASTADQGYAEAEASAPPAPSAKAAPLAQRSAAGAGAPREAFSVSQGVAAAATGGQVGELFQYVIDKPVSLPRQQSAMLPILNQQVSGERYSLFNESTDPTHPLNAVRLRNSSSLHLMQGPITVFDGGTYAGDAEITDLAPGAEQLVTYALDLDTEVHAASGSAPTSLLSVRISKGIVYSTYKAQQERDYTIRNNGTKNRTVLIEHPVQAEWTLSSPAKPSERTRDVYRFVVPVAAKKTASLAVIQTRTVEQTISLSALGSDQVGLFLRNPVVSPAVKAALQKLADLQRRLSDTTSQRAARESRVAEISNDQSRIRANMDRLSQSSDLFKRYVKTLSDEEDELGRLREEIAKLRDQEAARQREIAAFIQGLEVS